MKDSDNLSDWYQTPTDRLLRRPSVNSLAAGDVQDLIDESVRCIRSKHLLELEALLSPDFVMNSFQFNGREFQQTAMTRYSDLRMSEAWFASNDTSQYSMSVASISMLGDREAKADVLVLDPHSAELHRVFGSPALELVSIGMHKDRPVIARIDVQLPESSNKHLQATRETRAPEA